MYIKKCDMENLLDCVKFYVKEVKYLEENVNYPRWESGIYPCEQTVVEKIEKGEQYIAYIGPFVGGAFVFNEDPAGDYSAGEWKQNLKKGEYAVIHTLAVNHSFYGRGYAKEMVNYCIDLAKKLGYKSIRVDVVPDNYPARSLYEGMGFTFAGDKDLGRAFDNIPTFCLYEFDLTKN